MLEQVKTGVDARAPIKACIYAGPGVGKTTFAASIRDALLIDTEGGSDHVDGQKIRVKTKQEFDQLLEELLTQDHAFKTVVIDTIDWLQQLVYDDIAKSAGVKNVQRIEFGRGLADAQAVIAGYLNKLQRLIDNRTNVVLLAHSMRARVNDNPDHQEIDRHQLKLQVNDKGVGVGPMVTEWCDYLLYCAYDDQFYAEGKGASKKTRAAESQDRVMYSEGHTNWMAKARRAIPSKIEMSWSALAQAHMAAAKTQEK